MDLTDGTTKVQTIGNKPPEGLCGTGVIETVSELVKEGYVDETGHLEEPYFKSGFPLGTNSRGETITFTQKDVREIQLAKSAVRAGIETLLKRFGTGYEDVDAVYLAGGFGFHMDQKKAVSIGLLPKELEKKLVTVGNSSLAGAVRYPQMKRHRSGAPRFLTGRQKWSCLPTVPLMNFIWIICILKNSCA